MIGSRNGREARPGAVSRLRSAAVGLLAVPPVAWLHRLIGQRRIAIFMLHRLEMEEQGIEGHRPDRLRAALQSLRRGGVRLLALDALVDAVQDGGADGDRPIACFTVDDGYKDMLDACLPVLSDFDCPLTGFVSPGLVDAGDWFWWDKVEWLLRGSQTSRARVELADGPLTLSWEGHDGWRTAHAQFCERIKREPAARREATLRQLSEATGVALPSRSPARYSLCDWDDLRAAERRAGARFGAHTMTHPILSRCSDAQAEAEIQESVRRVREELHNPSGVFCYPNGTPDDFGPREMAIVERLGMSAAVSTISGTMDRAALRAEWPARRWALPRVSFDERPGAVLRLAVHR